MPNGVIREFDGNRGDGLIAPDDGGGDVFFVCNENVCGEDRTWVKVGAKVTYELDTDIASDNPVAKKVRHRS